jgi:putative transcriptional regulator
MLRPDELTARPEVLATPALSSEVPQLQVQSEFNVREFLGLDPWPPRRTLNVLQRARVASGLSQDELAAELQVSRQTVSAIENRRTVPSVRLALAIAIALNGTVEELFAADELR